MCLKHPDSGAGERFEPLVGPTKPVRSWGRAETNGDRLVFLDGGC